MRLFSRPIATLIVCVLLSSGLYAQVNKVLFLTSKAQMAGNADWVLDADTWNIGYPSPGLAVVGAGNESNPARFPTPAQSNINSSTAETFWKGALSSWGVSLVKLGYTVETLPYNGQITYNSGSNVQDLSYYKVLVVCEPNILFTAAEKTAIVQWVQAGGGLFMIADHSGSDRNNDGSDSRVIWNDLMTNNSVQSNPFGISFDSQNFSQTTSNRANLPANKVLNGTQGSVTQLQYSAGTTMTISPSANSTVKGLFWKTGATQNNYNIMLAQANFGAGRVVAIGDSSPADDGTGDSNDALYNGFTGQVSGNHKKMFLNATIWLAGNAGSEQALDDRDNNPTDAGLATVSIFPNPTAHVVTVNGLNPELPSSLTLLDAAGRVCLQQQVEGAENTVLDTERLTAGAYYLQVRNSAGNKVFMVIKL